jgi:hypothetical protein
MSRYRVVDQHEAANALNSEEHISDWCEGWESYLLDTQTNMIVFADGHEPEDMFLDRDLSIFVELLNNER